jgi:hypothetical protein
MATANYYDLHAKSVRIIWYPNGKGGPIGAGHPTGPVLEYSDGSQDITASGADLVVGTQTKAGTFVTAVVRKNGIVPGAVTSIGVLIPDAVVGSQPVPIDTLGVLAIHRPIAAISPGQLESYTKLKLTGTASRVELPL